MMTSWLFKIKDSATDITVVVGAGDTIEDAESDALSKWEALYSLRGDYSDRSPVISITAYLSTAGEPPNLII